MDNEANGKLCYSIAETAELLGISVCLTRELVRQKKIPSLKLSERRILIPRLLLEKMLSNGAAVAEPQADNEAKGQK
jgi:excisionase family DNA binding protein